MSRYPNFRAYFCSIFACSEQEFASQFLSKIMYPHAAWLARLTLKFFPRLWAVEIEAIREIGQFTNLEVLRWYGRRIKEEYERHHCLGLFRRLLRLRISGRRILHLSQEMERRSGSRP